MIAKHFMLTAPAFMLLSLNLAFSDRQVKSSHRRVPSPPAPSIKARGEWRDVSERALTRLRVLRDGWNDVNRQYISPNFEAASKLDPREYEVQYLEAKSAVTAAVEALPKGELRDALRQAMELFDDLEKIRGVFEKTSPLTTSVRVADVYPYLNKYSVPYESGVVRASYGLVLHKDFVMSFLLPLRYERVNRVEVLMGGEPQPVPPPPTYEQMYRVPARKPAPAPAAVNVEELKEVARRALEARLRGNKDQMDVMLAGDFVRYDVGGRQWDKGQYLKAMSPDPTVRGLALVRADLSFRGEAPVLSTTVRYESFLGEFKRYENTFTFARQGGKWLIATWRAY
jgi:hypothetical protein